MAKSSVSWIQRVKVGGIALAILVGVIVAFQNTEAVETRVLFATVTMPRAILLLLSGLVGFALGVVTALALVRRKAGSS